MDLSLTALLIIGLGTLAFLAPMQLGPAANPTDAQYIPRPEWYYLPIFQWLKYWHGAGSIIGILVIPSLLALAVVGLPFWTAVSSAVPGSALSLWELMHLCCSL